MSHRIIWLRSFQIRVLRMSGHADGPSVSTALVTSGLRAPACCGISVRIVQAHPGCPISDPQFPSVTASHLFTLSSLAFWSTASRICYVSTVVVNKYIAAHQKWKPLRYIATPNAIYIHLLGY